MRYSDYEQHKMDEAYSAHMDSVEGERRRKAEAKMAGPIVGIAPLVRNGSTCLTCGTTRLAGEIVQVGHRFGNAVCQGCGYDARVHGDTGTVFTNDEFGERQ
jgi:hypothetical protein